MDQLHPAAGSRRTAAWISVSQEPSHPLASLEASPVPGGSLRLMLGRRSRFGARYVAIFLATDGGGLSREAILTGLHNTGPLPTYNWFEVAETRDSVALPNGDVLQLDADLSERVLELLLSVLPPGGHLMVEYDSPARAETARALALGVPPLATPLGELLFRVGCGARFKDWQIAEGGGEGPRKLQGYKPLSQEHALRWRKEVLEELRSFVQERPATSEVVRRGQERATRMISRISGDKDL